MDGLWRAGASPDCRQRWCCGVSASLLLLQPLRQRWQQRRQRWLRPLQGHPAWRCLQHSQRPLPQGLQQWQQRQQRRLPRLCLRLSQRQQVSTQPRQRRQQQQGSRPRVRQQCLCCWMCLKTREGRLPRQQVQRPGQQQLERRQQPSQRPWLCLRTGRRRRWLGSTRSSHRWSSMRSRHSSSYHSRRSGCSCLATRRARALGPA